MAPRSWLAKRRWLPPPNDYVILRTAWVYAPYGKNFVRTMLALAETRKEVRVVADQLGCPTYAPDIAMAIVRIARNLLGNPSDLQLRGIFHLTGRGETSWAGFASAIFAFLAAKGLPEPELTPIASDRVSDRCSSSCQLPAQLCQARCVYGIELPSWRDSLGICLERILSPS